MTMIKTPIEIDQLGGEHRRVPRPRREHLVLVHTQSPDAVQTRGVLDPRGSMVLHGAHGAPPAHTEVPGHSSHRLAVLAHPPTDLGSSSSRETPLDLLACLGEGVPGAVWIHAATDACAK